MFFFSVSVSVSVFLEHSTRLCEKQQKMPWLAWLVFQLFARNCSIIRGKMSGVLFMLDKLPSRVLSEDFVQGFVDWSTMASLSVRRRNP